MFGYSHVLELTSRPKKFGQRLEGIAAIGFTAMNVLLISAVLLRGVLIARNLVEICG